MRKACADWSSIGHALATVSAASCGRFRFLPRLLAAR
jgi:hypothetical protein